MLPSPPPISKPSASFRTKMFNTLETTTKYSTVPSFFQITPSSGAQKQNQAQVHNFLYSQDSTWEHSSLSLKAFETFLSSIDFSSTYIPCENQVSPPINNKESPCFIRKLHKSRDFKSEEKFQNSNNTLGLNVYANRRLQFSNYKTPKVLDSIPEMQGHEVDNHNYQTKRLRGKSVDSAYNEKRIYRRKAEVGMFKKKHRIQDIERIIEESEDLSSHRGNIEDERAKKSQTNFKKARDELDDEEEWRCTSSSLSIYSKLSKESLNNTEYVRESEKIDQEILEFIKKRIIQKGILLGKKDLARQSFSKELMRMKDVIENALTMCQENLDFNIVDSS